MSNEPGPTCNLLLAELPLVDRARIFPELKAEVWPEGAVLYDAGSRLEQVYFPVAGIVALNYLLRSGLSSQVALVGSEGIVGISAVLNSETYDQAVVQNAGLAYALPLQVIQRELSRDGQLLPVLLRFAQTLMMQIAYTATSIRHHTVGQRVRRWLILNLDRSPRPELDMSPELIAKALSVSRQEVAESIEEIQGSGAIRYSHGRITVTDRIRLESFSQVPLAGNGSSSQ